MALNPFASKKKSIKAPIPPQSQEKDSEIQGERGLPSLFDKGVTLQKKQNDLLDKGLSDGLAFFNEFNNERMKLAFQSFTEDMKNALYEVIFFLHVNDPSYSEIKFTVTS